MSREHFLKTLGYQEPYDESPVDTPEGWHGGAVANTGGNIMCRIWRTWEGNEKASPVEYEVIYNVSMDNGVALERHQYNDQEGYYEHEETEEVRKAKYHSDTSQAETALELMNYVTNELRTKEEGDTETDQQEDCSKTQKIESDIEHINDNYHHCLYVNNRMEGYPLLMLKNHSGDNDILDEIVSIIPKYGYESAYVDFDKEEVAFSPIDCLDDISEDVLEHIRNGLEKWDIDIDGDLSALKLVGGYEVAVPFSGELLRDTMESDGQGPLLYGKDNIWIEYRGMRDGELLLKVAVEDKD